MSWTVMGEYEVQAAPLPHSLVEGAHTSIRLCVLTALA